ncbi:aldo/keto reductase [Leptolyngbya sp. PCC 6406]|uniref:aldo/keto reductase n=1 Tax=Leptolyngbya sp. PCC 6406 TaxID=1173264 RepID=UPI0002AC04BB|nr:aldo/keto reductase [Leptolyngbya sp. PCC 6406]
MVIQKIQRNAKSALKRGRNLADDIAYATLYRQPPMVDMQYVTLGRTGLKVSVMGLGSGGSSQLGLKKGQSDRHAIRLIHHALDCGINLLDTAKVYGTEAIIGRAIKGYLREKIILSTKYPVTIKEGLMSPEKLAHGIDKSLHRLGTDYIDILHFHGVECHQYDYVLTVLLPVLISAQEAGKIRFIGITEAFSKDTHHQMLTRAVQDDCWDVMMLGFNFLNQSARTQVLVTAQEKNIGVLAMFAVRRALINSENLKRTLENFYGSEQWDPSILPKDVSLEFLFHDGGATSLTDAAYRYVRHEPGIHSVLFGTSQFSHLESNIKSLLKPSLSAEDYDRLNAIFGRCKGISGD